MITKHRKKNENFTTIKKYNVTLKKVTKSDCRFLFNLLKQRDSITNISHKNMPSYSQHVKFVLSKPYLNWYVIRLDNKNIGSVYLSHQKEIGIFTDKKFKNKGIATKALKLIIKKNPYSRYLSNINPKNKNSIKFFKKNKFKLIQHTYELTKSKLN